jgi:hypothetical protein
VRAGPSPVNGSKNAAIERVSAKNFDGTVYAFARTGDILFAATSEGMLRSVSSGTSWQLVPLLAAGDWRFVAAVRSEVLAATLDALALSVDGGTMWKTMHLPAEVTRVSAVTLDGAGTIWVAGREGVYYSVDRGDHWQSLRNLYIRNVNSIFYDQQANRILVTSNGPETKAFAVQLPTMQVSTWDTGWNLRFVRPVGDHLVAGTLFDGIVVQPRMVDSAEVGTTTTAQR